MYVKCIGNTSLKTFFLLWLHCQTFFSLFFFFVWTTLCSFPYSEMWQHSKYIVICSIRNSDNICYNEKRNVCACILYMVKIQQRETHFQLKKVCDAIHFIYSGKQHEKHGVWLEFFQIFRRNVRADLLSIWQIFGSWNH